MQRIPLRSTAVRVLIIGVRDYTDPATPPAAGALHDAIGWWHYAVRRLGVDPAGVRLLTSPVLSPESLVDAIVAPDDATRDALLGLAVETTCGPATGAQIRDALAWLMRGEGQRLLTFSGHGVASDALLEAEGDASDLARLLFAGADHAHTSPADYGRYFDAPAADGLPGAATLAPLAVRAAAHGVGGAQTVTGQEAQHPLWVDDLTVIIDACFSTPRAADGASRDGAPAVARADGALEAIIGTAGRGLLACDLNHPCATIDLNGRPQGAWSWALQTALSRWQTVDDGRGRVQATITHAELHARARALLDALGVDQRPLIAGPRAVDQTCLLGPLAVGALRGASGAAPTPDLPFALNQLLPVPGRGLSRWMLEVGSAPTPGGTIEWIEVGLLFTPLGTVFAGDVMYLGGVEHWRTKASGWSQAQAVWSAANRHDQRLQLRPLPPMVEDGPDLPQWLDGTFENYGVKFNTQGATNYGGGVVQPPAAPSGFPMLVGLTTGPRAGTRAAQFVFGTGNDVNKMTSQRWFWRAPGKPDPSVPTNSGQFLRELQPVDSALVLRKINTIAPAPSGALWYTHASVGL